MGGAAETQAWHREQMPPTVGSRERGVPSPLEPPPHSRCWAGGGQEQLTRGALGLEYSFSPGGGGTRPFPGFAPQAPRSPPGRARPCCHRAGLLQDGRGSG